MKVWYVLVAILICAPVLRAADEPEPVDQKKVEAAVEKGLQFLKKSRAGEAWGRAETTQDPSATGLSVLAFLSAGHSPGKGPYGEVIEKAVDWVVDHQREDGFLQGPFTKWGGMEEHGVATWMLAEAMTKADEKLQEKIKPALVKAVALILKAQVTDKKRFPGGWGEGIEETSSSPRVTGWQILALVAAKKAGCEVPQQCLDDAVSFVKLCSNRTTGEFCDWPAGPPNLAATGVGIHVLALQAAGEDPSPALVKVGKYLLANPPKAQSSYYSYGIYGGTAGGFQLGGEHWREWQRAVFPPLLNAQNESGWWRDRHTAGAYGPNIYTALAILALTVDRENLIVHKRPEKKKAE
jgi:hypothetical protein